MPFILEYYLTRHPPQPEVLRTEAGEDLFGPLSNFVAKYEWRAGGQGVRIEKAAFGDLAGAIGAAGFALMESERKH